MKSTLYCSHMIDFVILTFDGLDKYSVRRVINDDVKCVFKLSVHVVLC